MCVEAKIDAGCPPRSLFTLSLRLGLSLNLELNQLARLAGQQSLEICLYLLPQHWDYKIHTTGNYTQVLALVQQALYQLRYPPSSQYFMNSISAPPKIPAFQWSIPVDTQEE